MKVYISGKITGLPLSEAEERFKDAEELISALNLTPVNPLKNGLPRDSSWEEHMAKDIELLKQCEAIFMLENWEDSRGAKIEYDFAIGSGKTIMYENQISNGRDLQKLTTAIHEVTGLTIKDLADERRTRDTVFARMIFAWHCKDMRPDDIGRIINRDRCTVGYYLNRYEDEVKYNPSFAKLANNVEKKLEKHSQMVE
jgi:chromosomal replication initiation ATPase DnaA